MPIFMGLPCPAESRPSSSTWVLRFFTQVTLWVNLISIVSAVQPHRHSEQDHSLLVLTRSHNWKGDFGMWKSPRPRSLTCSFEAKLLWCPSRQLLRSLVWVSV